MLTRRTRTPARDTQAHRKGEGGQALVLFTLMLTVLLGAVALVLDQGLLRKANQDLWNALDAGALAGALELPGDGVAADRVARQYVQDNFPGGLPDSGLEVSFRCLIGVKNGSPRLSDVPRACDPGPGVSWTWNGSIATAVCDPAAGDDCNTIVVASPAEVDYNFGPVVGVFGGSVGVRLSAACKGPCGAPPEAPVDLVMVLDRTSSMSGVDTENARRASDSVRVAYDPDMQWIGFGVLGPSQMNAGCATQADTTIGTARTPGDLRRWIPVGISGIGAKVNEDYRSSDSKMAKAIACFGNSSTRTDLADPVRMATYELETNGRSDVTRAILLLSDGEPNVSTSGRSDNCREAAEAAADAKSKGIEVFTVGFGLDDGALRCPDPSGPYWGKSAAQLLADMATDSTFNGCPGGSNDDGDHFFCVPKTSGASADLSTVFRKAIDSLVANTRLVKLP